MLEFDTVITHATVFDGTGGPSRVAHVGLKDGVVAVISEVPLPDGAAREVVDGRGQWLMPGFIDFHTHYDVEVELSPQLSESLRHGVTTITLGSCSLSTALGTPEDIADIFCRVEAVPRSVVLPLLETRKSWEGFPEYLDHLGTLPLGPNVTSFVGHSNLRMHVMGFSRSVDRHVRPTADELTRMERLLNEGLDAGCLGMSIQTLPWDKLDGSRHRSRPLPSYFARWSEYRHLTRTLRARGRVFQGVPNITTKVIVFMFLWESTGIFRRSLKTTVISLMDIRANRGIWWQVPILTRLFNKFLRADFRLQALPNLFDVWADGLDLVIFEELGCGTEVLHLTDPVARAALCRDPDYRRRLRKEWGSLLSPRVYHRNMQYTEVLACPDASLVGRSFADIAAARGAHPVDVFLDLAGVWDGAALVLDHGQRPPGPAAVHREAAGCVDRVLRRGGASATDGALQLPAAAVEARPGRAARRASVHDDGARGASPDGGDRAVVRDRRGRARGGAAGGPGARAARGAGREPGCDDRGGDGGVPGLAAAGAAQSAGGLGGVRARAQGGDRR